MLIHDVTRSEREERRRKGAGGACAHGEDSGGERACATLALALCWRQQLAERHDEAKRTTLRVDSTLVATRRSESARLARVSCIPSRLLALLAHGAEGRGSCAAAMLHIPGRKKPLPLPKSLAASAPRPVAPSADSTLAVPQRATQKRVQGLFDKMNAIRRKKQPAAPPNSATPPRAAQSASPPRPLSTQQHSPNTNADSADFAPTQPRDVVGEETLVSNMEFGGGFDDTDEQSTVTPYDLASSVPPASTSETMVAATTGRQGRCSGEPSELAIVRQGESFSFQPPSCDGELTASLIY